MPRLPDIYLDIETSWEGDITVVGFYSRATGLVQLVGSDVTDARLDRELPDRGNLFTYNGHCFDIPVIRKVLGVDLRDKFESYDLRWICQRNDLRGGQKAVEKAIGLPRELMGMDGRDALVLWQRYVDYDDEEALATLLKYNREDVLGLMEIKRHCERNGFLQA